MEETEADVTPYDVTPLHSSVNSNEPGMDEPVGALPAKLRVPFNKYDMFYDMSGNKYMHVFNHFEYENNQYYGPNPKTLTRYGTHEDVKNLEDTFESLGFKTTVHNDLRYKYILKEMSKVCSMDHSGTSCVAVAIMTHGNNGGVLAAADQPYRFSEVSDMMQNGHPSLVGKPKLFFVQACRSGHMDSGRPVLLSAENLILPTDADTLVMYSTSPHYVSYRNRCTGSWLMQSLCEVLNEHHQFFDLLQMLTLVNQAVAYKVTHNKTDPEKSNKKQMPETKHTLTKLLKF